jgi:translation initiation factor 1
MARDNEWKKRSGVVYSTDPRFSYNKDTSGHTKTPDPAQQHLRVYLDRSHRKGKEVTLVKNFVGHPDDAEALCKKLKVYCGAGGSVKDGEIIIQGDQRTKVQAYLAQAGYKVKG